MNKQKRDLLVFGYGLATIALFISWRVSVKHGWGVTNNILSFVTLSMLYITVFNERLLKAIYTKWMIGAGFIGKIVSALILSLLFYFLFAPVGIVLRIFGKDLLDQKLEPEKSSYWILRKSQKFEQDHYKRQF